MECIAYGARRKEFEVFIIFRNMMVCFDHSIPPCAKSKHDGDQEGTSTVPLAFNEEVDISKERAFATSLFRVVSIHRPFHFHSSLIIVSVVERTLHALTYLSWIRYPSSTLHTPRITHQTLHSLDQGYHTSSLMTHCSHPATPLDQSIEFLAGQHYFSGLD